MALSTSLPSGHNNGVTPRATQTIAYGGPPIEPPFYTEHLTSCGNHIDEISHPVPRYAVLSKGIPQQNPPLGPHMQAFSMADVLGVRRIGGAQRRGLHMGRTGSNTI